MRPYSPERHEFSRKMSAIAFRQIYVPVFGAVGMKRTDNCPDGPTDPDLRGTDVVLILRSGRRITVAERFRRAPYVAYDDITIRCSSLLTGRKLEIVGLNAQYMLYAVANEDETGFLRWDILYAPKLMEIVDSGSFEKRHNADGSSVFLAVPRKLLLNSGAIMASSEAERRAS
ncbi:MAG: hypothetical protein ACPLTR_04685 [Thermacetogeniaceae bacterium]